ncbi:MULTISPECIES: hypothetical protein [Actinomadura]|uniref:DUF8083 domain-containing protein n=1 Tax=Actinomadura litoris TaxID=2678616 RepID=A0A7K1L212_9ACTN|nr:MULTISPECIES: hypothetical protein [Actinomadura]MBT2206634.1 hypothetical protein [Actinomadura sp. NEAU-AAG7]MUN38266.1 hypothetical protein [Actinomadura litoris]
MFPYAAYLRVYEPVTAFPQPARTLWTAYADSRRRPRRIHALAAEHREAARRLTSAPPEVVPDRESRDAYVRRSDDMIFICPWETRLRSWLAFERFRDERSAGVAAAFVPPTVAERATSEFERWKRAGRSLRPHILTDVWHVPLAWFVPFARSERCLMLGAPGTGYRTTSDALQEHAGHGPATAARARTLIYVTSMGEARRRVASALPVVRANLGEGAADAVPLSAGRLEALGRWLEEFHPRALVELDYGGLVHLLDDRTLQADESVAEMSVALAAMERGEAELAVAMYKRLLARWRPVRALETAN